MDLYYIVQVVTQIFGVCLICCGLDSNKTIWEKSKTCFNMNPELAKELIKDRHFKIIGLLAITIPQLFDTLQLYNIWFYLGILAIALILCIPKIRNFISRKSYQKISTLCEEYYKHD